MELFNDLVDIDITIYDDSEIYLKFKDYFLDNKKTLYIYDNNYYLNIDKIAYKEFITSIEFCDIIYGKELDKIKSKLLLLTKSY